MVLLRQHVVCQHACGVYQTAQPRKLSLAHLRNDLTPVHHIAHVATSPKPLRTALLQLLYIRCHVRRERAAARHQDHGLSRARLREPPGRK